MRAVVWGCRGSIASPGPDTVRYGGNTSCVSVTADDGTEIVLDAGTGMRALGTHLAGKGVDTVHVLLTHLHMDHLQGIGFFRPLFTPGCRVHIWGPTSPVQSLVERITTYLSPPLFPVGVGQLAAEVTFHDAPDEPWQIGSMTVSAENVAHQGSTLGYRLTEGTTSLAYIPDHEPALGVDLSTLEPSWVSGYSLAQGASVLLHDAQYTPEEYPDHIGWGHSSIDHTVDLAAMAEVDRLVLFHHDPMHTDADLDDLLAIARRRWPGRPEAVELAFEGMALDVTPAADTTVVTSQLS